MSCKKISSPKDFLFYYMFLLCKIAFNICKINGGVPSYFSCHRATSDRVRFYAFWQAKLSMSRGNNREIPFVRVARGVTFTTSPSTVVSYVCAVSGDDNLNCL